MYSFLLTLKSFYKDVAFNGSRWFRSLSISRMWNKRIWNTLNNNIRRVPLRKKMYTLFVYILGCHRNANIRSGRQSRTGIPCTACTCCDLHLLIYRLMPLILNLGRWLFFLVCRIMFLYSCLIFIVFGYKFKSVENAIKLISFTCVRIFNVTHEIIGPAPCIRN